MPYGVDSFYVGGGGTLIGCFAGGGNKTINQSAAADQGVDPSQNQNKTLRVTHRFDPLERQQTIIQANYSKQYWTRRVLITQGL